MKVNIEDLGLYARWLREIIDRHCGPVRYLNGIYMERHKRVKNIEIDLLVRCEGEKRVTKIIVEIKENDLPGVLEQAVERRGLGDYVYVAVDISVPDILNWMASPSLQDLAEEALGLGIGVVSMRDDTIVFKSFSKNHLQWARRRTGILKFIPQSPETSS